MSTEPNNKYPKIVRVIVSDPDATDSSSDESSVTDRSSGKKVVREIVLGVKARDGEEEFEARKMGQNLVVASGSGYDPTRKMESGMVRVGNGDDGKKVVGSSGPGGLVHDPWVVRIRGPVDVLKLEGGEVKKEEIGLKRVRPVGFGNGVTFKTPKFEA
ncbi:AP2/ERF domain-containing protein [Artemisia annua]|uniref:AP2/ERF domain-containing protein n=1 Tax=Artemisia annua TaxID=35608 RepID=A0A2U1NAD7_ARTAN|nr:AP2/ERF domain-containing protein [Artemisia annua]